VGEIVPD